MTESSISIGQKWSSDNCEENELFYHKFRFEGQKGVIRD